MKAVYCWKLRMNLKEIQLRIKIDDILIKKSNIKSFGRFRPLSQMELQLSQTGIGNISCTLQQNHSVVVTGSNGQQTQFTLDRIFSSEESQ
jgi:hypothetical protein